MAAFASAVAAGDARVRADSFTAGERAFERGDLAQAAALWRPLARAGSARAQHAMGVLRERGAGPVAADPEQAAAWYRRAARQGHADARTNLGRLYANGDGVARDPARAAELWRKAAEDGHAVAQYNLALAYRAGNGVETDRRRAGGLLQRAARQGLPAAQHALARMYRLGRGLPRDPGLALAWSARAAEQGHARARRQARRLRERGVRPASLERAARPADAATTGGEGTPERFTVWLGSAGSRAGARDRWAGLRARATGALADLRVRFRTVPAGEDATVTRILAGRLPDREAAGRVCARVRAEAPAAFCQVRAAGR